jgi:hypothetical protein
VPLGLGEGVGALGSQPGPDPGRQCPGGLPGRVPVDGQLGGDDRRRTGRELRPFGKGMSVGGVQAGPLTRQQTSVDDLPQQGVAELIAVLTRHQQLVSHHLAQRTVQLPFVQAGNSGQQRMRDLPARHCRHPQDLPGRLRQGLDAALEQVTQGRGQRAGAGPRALQQLLGEEGVAFRAVKDAVHQIHRWDRAQDPGELGGGLGPVQASQQ